MTLLFFPPPKGSSGPIAVTTAGQAVAVGTTVTIPVTVTTGNTVVLMIGGRISGTGTAAFSVSSPGATWTQITQVDDNQNINQASLWKGTGVITGNITATSSLTALSLFGLAYQLTGGPTIVGAGAENGATDTASPTITINNTANSAEFFMGVSRNADMTVAPAGHIMLTTGYSNANSDATTSWAWGGVANAPPTGTTTTITGTLGSAREWIIFGVEATGGTTTTNVTASDTGSIAAADAASGRSTTTTDTSAVSLTEQIAIFSTAAAASTFVDDFTTYDSTKWGTPPTGAVWANGQVAIDATPAYPSIFSANRYSLVNNAIAVTMVQRPNISNGSTEAHLRFQMDVNNSVSLIVTNTAFASRSLVNGVDDTTYTGYDPTHTHMRIRHAAGTVYWETGPDGINWTVQRSLVTATDFSNGNVALIAGNWNAATTPGTAIFDDLNVGFNSFPSIVPIVASDTSAISAVEVSSAVPQTGQTFSDNFNRADGPLTGAGTNWAAIGGTGTQPIISGNQVVPQLAASHGIRYTTATNTDDQVSQMVWKGALFTGCAVQMPAFANAAAAGTVGLFYIFRVNSATTISMGQKDNASGTYTAYVNKPGLTLVAGDVLRMEYQSGVLRGYVNGVLQITTTPTTVVTGNRYVGGSLTSPTQTTPMWDDWTGGDLATTTTVNVSATDQASISVADTSSVVPSNAGTVVSAPTPLAQYLSTASVTTSGPVAVGTAVPVGTLIAVAHIGGGTGYTAGVTDSKGNTWYSTSPVSAAGVISTTQIFWTLVTNALTATDTITATRTVAGGLTWFASTMTGASGNIGPVSTNFTSTAGTTATVPSFAGTAGSTMYAISSTNSATAFSLPGGSTYTITQSGTASGTGNPRMGVVVTKVLSADDSALAPTLTLTPGSTYAMIALTFLPIVASTGVTANDGGSLGLTETSSVVPSAAAATVAIIGDSLTYRSDSTANPPSRESVTRAKFIAAGYTDANIYWWGVGGKPLVGADSAGKTTVQNIADARTQLGVVQTWIIGLGTNDTGSTDTVFNANVQTILDTIGTTDKIIWIGLAYFNGANTNAAHFNPLLKAKMDATPNATYMDWNTYIHAYPDQASLWISPVDATHMTVAGWEILDNYKVALAPIPASTTGKVSADFSAASAADSSVINIQTNTVPISASDTAAVSVADTSALFNTLPTTDTASISIAETNSRFNTFTSTESNSLSVNEVTGFGTTVPAADNVAVGVTEQASLFVSVTTTDTSAVSVADVSTRQINFGTTDTGSISASDVGALVVVSSTTDTGSVAAADVSAATRTAQITATDTTAISVAEVRFMPGDLLWEDNFNGPAGTQPNTAYWNFDVGGAAQFGNNELEQYTARTQNVVLDGAGNLNLIARQETFNGASYTSGRINTSGKITTSYGRIEGRINIPAGNGLWPTIWLMGEQSVYGQWPRNGEIDIMEAVNGMETSSGAIHASTVSNPATQWQIYQAYTSGIPTLAGAYHIYAIEWEPDAIHFYVDSTRFRSIYKSETTADQAWLFNDRQFYVILNLAVGGDMPGRSPDVTTVFPAIMSVDYVRFYQRTAYNVTEPKTNTLVDAFTDYREFDNWNNGVLQNGALRINTASSYPTLVSQRYFDLSNSSLSVELAQTPNVGTGTTSAVMGFESSPGNALQIGWGNNSIITRQVVGGVEDSTFTFYNAVNHRYLRLFHNGTNVLFQASPDTLTWTTLRTLAPTVPLTRGHVTFTSGYYGTETTPGYVLFDNVNSTATSVNPTAADTTGISIAESTASFVSLIRTDTSAVSITEVSNAGASQPANDTAAVGVTEQTTIAVTLSTTDSSAVSVVENTSSLLTSTRTDTTAVSVADLSVLNSYTVSTDTTAISVADVSATFKTIVANDTSAVSVNDISIVSSTLPGTESVAVSVADQAVTFVVQPAVDTGSISVTEVSANAVSQPASDFGALSIAETTTIVVTQSTSDTAFISVTEVVVGYTNTTASDTGAVSANDISSIGSTLPGTENIAVSVTEQAITNVTVTTIDTGSISIADVSAQYSAPASVDSAAISVTEARTQNATFATADTGSIAIADVSAAFKTLTTNDTGSIAVGDISNIANASPAQDNATVAVIEQTDAFVLLTVTDGATVSVTDTSAPLVNTSPNDQSAISLTDVSTVNVFVSSTESVAVSIVDISSLAKTISAVDTVSISINENSNLGTTSPANDTVSVGVTEQTTSFITVNTTDSAAVSVVDVSVSQSSLTTNDTTALVVTEANVLLVSQARTDTTAVSTTESTGGSVAATAGDIGSLAANDISSIGTTSPANESTAVAVTEQATIYVSTSTSDNNSLTVDEAQISVSFISRTDALGMAVVDNASTFITTPASESVSLSIAESSIVFADVAKSASDTGSIAAADSSSFSTVAIVASESNSVSVSEATAFARNIATSDSSAVSVTEIATPFNQFPGQDTGSVSVAETSAVTTSGGISKSAIDTTAVSVSDTSSRLIGVPTNEQASVSVNDVSSLTISGLLLSSSTDTSALSTSETVQQFISITRTDTSAFIVSEVTTGNNTVSATDTDDIAVTEAVTSYNVFTAVDQSAFATTETSGTFFTAPGQDTSALVVSETSSIGLSGQITVSASDSSDLTVTEQNILIVSFNSNDNSAVSVADSSTGRNTMTATDISAISVSESRSQSVTFARTDTGSLALTEARQFGTVAIEDTDEALVSVNETAYIYLPLPGTDIGALMVTEEAVVQVSGGIAKTASDTLAVSLSEQHIKGVQLASQDRGALALTETMQFGLIDQSANDNISLIATESGDAEKSKGNDDGAAIRVTESVNITTRIVIMLVSASDTPNLAIAEMDNVYEWGRSKIPIRFEGHSTNKSNFASDSKRGTIIISSGQGQIHFS